ncbi:MAG: serine hydrolase domain-containing protein [Polaribacter sp.]|uniref:serine hydrolase domain-containing protein n=1 Tax=Polaribacter sp. TaxID=1920175 RepID=UPI003BAF6964
MKTKQLKLVALVICYFLAILNAFSQDQKKITKTVTETDIDAVFEQWKNSQKPGLAVSIIKEGKVIYLKGYGSANMEYDIPITPNTIFHAASLSKQFTAFAILLLEADGKLSLKDDIRKYVPEVPDFGNTITLEQLASHTSGLRDQWGLLKMAGFRLDDVITTNHILKLIERQKELNFKPGDEDLYTNTGFTLLAEVVARVSGQSFAEFTKNRIFNPLGMDNTQFYEDHEKIVKNRAYSYHESDNEFKKSVLSYATVGPTSLFITAKDFAKWALNFENPIVGSMAIIEKLNTQPKLNNGNVAGFALGQITGKYQGIKVFVHSGSDAGYKAYFVRVPEHKLSVIVLANTSSIDPVNQAFGIVNLYLKDYFKEIEKKNIFEPNPEKFISLSNLELQEFEGDYWEPNEGYKRKIYIKNDTLMYFRSKQSESKLVPIDRNKFKMLGDTEDVTVVFNKNKNHEPQLEFHVNEKPPLVMLRYTNVNLEPYNGGFYSEELETYYRFKIKDGKLIAEHSRLEDIEFLPIQKDIFTSDNKNYKTLQFVRNISNQIIGLTFSNERIRKLWFEKSK